VRQVLEAMPWMLGGRFRWEGGRWIIGRFFGGVLDDLRWWSVARSQQEIKTYMAWLSSIWSIRFMNYDYVD